MQTQCPQCETRFRITDMQLKAAEGHVRCGLCDEVFNALAINEGLKNTLNDEDINLPETNTQEIDQPLDVDKNDIDKNNEETLQQEVSEQNAVLETEEDTLLDEKQPSESDTTEPDINDNQDEPDQDHDDDSSNKDDDASENTSDIDSNAIPPPDDENKNELDDNIDDKNSDITPDEDNQTQGEQEELSNKNSETDTIDPNDLDIDNAEQHDDDEIENIYLDENDSGSSHESNNDTDDSINIEINDNDDSDEASNKTNNEDNQEKALDFFEEEHNQDSRQIIPDELREASASNGTSVGTSLAWVAGIGLLSITLALQYLWLNRDQYAQSDDAQALIEKLCLNFDCSKLTIKDPSNIELLTRNVYSHPNENNALMISIVLQNNARFSQPYPVLQINFSDIRGDAVVARRFTPAEYLKIDQKKHPLLQPGTSANFNLEIQDPGKQAITYEFNFL